MKTPDRVGQGLEGLLQLSEVALGFSPFEPWPENTFPLRIRPEGLRIQEKAGWDSMQHICHSARIREKVQAACAPTTARSGERIRYRDFQGPPGSQWRVFECSADGRTGI